MIAYSVALRGREGGATAELGDEIAGCLRASGGGGDKAHVLAPVRYGDYRDQLPGEDTNEYWERVLDYEYEHGIDPHSSGAEFASPIAFDSRQDCVSSTEVFGALGSSSPQAQAVAFSCKYHGGDATVELAPTMRAMGHQGSHANAGGQLAVCITGDITHTLKAEGFDASEDGTGRGQPIVAAFAENSRAELRYEGGDGQRTGALSTGGGKPGQGTPMLQVGMAVRRLTPTECARLQGFPDDYLSQVLVRGKPMADGPMYKALGNSWAVPNVRWIGARIDARLRALSGSINAPQ